MELEEEELEGEEVDNKESSDDDDHHGSAGSSASSEYTYDPSVVVLHSYLGDVEYTRNRLAFLDGGAVLTLPLFYLEGVVLFPEAILPLRVVFHELIVCSEKAMTQVDAPYTIAVVRVSGYTNDGTLMLSTTGTTAEIRQYRRLADGSVNIVARGQQRFRIKDCWRDPGGSPFAEVQIIQEDIPLRPPREAVGKLVPLRNLQAISSECELSSAEESERQSEFQSPRSSTDSLTEFNGQNTDNSLRFGKKPLSQSPIGRRRDVPRAFWPSWVYRMYDSYSLALKAADRWKQVVKAPSMDSLVMKPDLLSFHIAGKIPISESVRRELLEIDGTRYRLCREIELLESFDKIHFVHCKNCQALIADRRDMLVMSSEGPLGAYANQHGLVHEVMTFTHTEGVAVAGIPVREFSWFPGFEWSIAECVGCENQLGWHFSATEKKMSPSAFWGIRTSQVVDETI